MEARIKIENDGGGWKVTGLGLEKPLRYPAAMTRMQVGEDLRKNFMPQIRAQKEKMQAMGGAPSPEKAALLGAGSTTEMFSDVLSRPRFGWGPEYEASQAEYDARADRRAETNAMIRDYQPRAFDMGATVPYFAPPARAGSMVGRAGLGLFGKIGAGAAEAVGRSAVADATIQGAVLGGMTDDGSAAEGAAYGLGGGLLGTALSRVFKPFDNNLSAYDQRMIDRGEELGYQVTPAQATGNRRLQNYEDALENNWFSSGSMERIRDANQANSNRIVAEALGFQGPYLTQVTPEMLDTATRRLSDRFNDIIEDAPMIRLDDEFLAIAERMIGKDPRWVASKKADKALWKAIDQATDPATGGMITSEAYQTISSDLTQNIMSSFRTGKNVRFAQDMQALKKALDDAAERSLPPGRVQEFRDVRGDYRVYSDLMKNRVINEAKGDVNLSALDSVLRKNDKFGYRRGNKDSDLYDAARFSKFAEGHGVNSRTAARQSIPQTLGLIGLSGAAGAAGGTEGVATGIGMGATIPVSLMLLGRHYGSKIGRAHLGGKVPIDQTLHNFLVGKSGQAAAGISQGQSGELPPIPLLNR